LGGSDTFVQLALPDSFGTIVTVETVSSSLDQDCASWHTAAERELGAFLGAVTELFGADQARQAAEDWLEELELQETFPALLNWRAITVNATIRLAQRLNRNDVDTKVSPLASFNYSGIKPRAEHY